MIKKSSFQKDRNKKIIEINFIFKLAEVPRHIKYFSKFGVYQDSFLESTSE
jgi:hypothetical protein